MALINMDSVQFYQPSKTAAKSPKNRHSVALDTSTPNYADQIINLALQDAHSSERIQDYVPVPIFDMAISPLPESTDPFSSWAPELKGAGHITDLPTDVNHKILANIQEENAATVEESATEPWPLSAEGQTREVEDTAGSIIGDTRGSSDANARLEELRSVDINFRHSSPSSSIPLPSTNSILSTISIENSSSRPQTPHHSLSTTTFPSASTSQTKRNLRSGLARLASTEKPYESIVGKECGEIEASHKAEAYGTARSISDSDSDDSDPPLLASSRKRKAPAVSGKPLPKRRRKRCRFPSPIISEEETSDTYERSNSSKRQVSIADDQSTPYLPRTSVVYRQQSWEGEIVDERDVKQARGRPRKQYLVRWKDSWVDKTQLNEQPLLQHWREKRDANNP